MTRRDFDLQKNCKKTDSSYTSVSRLYDTENIVW